MGLDKIIAEDKEWKSSVNHILIKNNICKTMKEINDALQKNINNSNNKALIENLQKNNKNYKKVDEEKKNKDKDKKNKPKFNNNNYNLLLLLLNVIKFKNVFKNLKIQKLENLKKLKIC